MADDARVKDFDDQELPWVYGDDRVTAMVRSPDSLYLYWEITDPAIAAARGRLGSAGAGGWCNLRVYDTSGRAFDGTNAHHYFDVRVERTDRELFLDLQRPTASIHVEIGIMSHEGYFQAIARSGRADFPRKGPSPNHSLDWMTVTSDDPHPAARPYGSKYNGAPARRGSSHPPAEVRPTSRHAIVGGPADVRPYSWVHPAFTEVRWEGPWFYEWRSEWKLRWIGPLGGETSLPIENAAWITGPFPMHLLDPSRLEIRFLGDEHVMLEEHASGLEVFGPWEVRIQSSGSAETGERRELAAWRVHFARVAPAKVETWWAAVDRARMNSWQRTRVVPAGASESLGVVEAGASELWRMGASERWTAGGSAWLAQGASEMWRMGASDLLYGAAYAEWLGSNMSGHGKEVR